MSVYSRAIGVLGREPNEVRVLMEARQMELLRHLKAGKLDEEDHPNLDPDSQDALDLTMMEYEDEEEALETWKVLTEAERDKFVALMERVDDAAAEQVHWEMLDRMPLGPRH